MDRCFSSTIAPAKLNLPPGRRNFFEHVFEGIDLKGHVGDNAL
jgi:hypothetical protein